MNKLRYIVGDILADIFFSEGITLSDILEDAGQSPAEEEIQDVLERYNVGDVGTDWID